MNGTFYSLTRPATCDGLAPAGPGRLRVRHQGQPLHHAHAQAARFEPPLANFFASGILRLGADAGPDPLAAAAAAAASIATARARFFAALPRDVAGAERWARRHDARTTGRAALTAPDGRSQPLRHALEIRHASWLGDEALALMRALRRRAGRRRHGRPPSAQRRADRDASPTCGCTARPQLYASRYERRSSRRGSQRIAAWARGGADVFVYFDNDARGHAPHDALRLREILAGGACAWRRRAAPRPRAPGKWRCPRRLIGGACACPRLRPRRDTRST